MKLIDGDNLIEHAEVNCESSDFVEKLIDYVAEQEEVSISQGHENDLISRQGMRDSLNKYRIEKMLEGEDVSLVWECIDKVLQEPSAQPEIVRCKECKWSYDDVSGRICSYGVCVDCVVNDDFYCADAERRTNG